MYIVDFSTKTIKYVHFKKTLLGKFEIKECGLIDCTEDDWKEKLKKLIKNQKIALVLPENISKIVRFETTGKINDDQLKKTIEEKIAEGDDSIDDYAFDCGIKRGSGDAPHDIFCVAALYKDLSDIFNFVQYADAKPTLAVPQSLSILRILRDGIIEGEIILCIDIEEEETHFIFYDVTGPVYKKSQKTTLTNLDKDTLNAVKEFNIANQKDVNRVVLTGVNSNEIDPFEFRRAVNILTIKGEDILKDRISKLKLKFECGNENIGRYLNAIGTGLLASETTNLNLAKKDVLINVERVAMKKTEEKKTEDKKTPESEVPQETTAKPQQPLDSQVSTEDTKKTAGESEKDTETQASKRPTLTAEPVKDEGASSGIGMGAAASTGTGSSADTGIGTGVGLGSAGAEEEKTESQQKETVGHTIGNPSSQFRSSFRSDDTKNGSGKKKILLFVIVALVVAGLAGVGLFFLGGTGQQEEPAEETVVVEPTASPTPEPQLERSELNVQVLNGIGEPGLAGDVATILEDVGYEDVGAANADAYDYEETVIQLKEEFEEYFSLLKEDLEEEGYVVGDDYEALDEDSDFDAVVTIGSLTEEDSEE